MSTVGALRHRLVHQTGVDLPDGAGGVTRTYLVIDVLWGAIETLAAESGAGEDRPRAVLRQRVTVRAPNTVAPGDLLVLGARRFQVEAVSDPDGRGRLTRCICREDQP